MQTKRYKYLILFLALFAFTGIAFAQPANDNCNAATLITDVDNWCSSTSAFTTVNGTASGVANPSCFPDDNDNDVWFSFVATGTDVNLRVIGNTNLNSGGSLQSPQLTLYEGVCNDLSELQCISDAFNNNLVETFESNLTIGQTYFIRVDARNNNTGTFQLCVNNFNQVPAPDSDCPTGVVLCDKSGFVVESVSGAGNDNDEADGSCLDGGNPGVPSESSSSWYIWTCDQAGTLGFSLTPNNPSDDLDFAVFELPAGVDDCNNKQLLRCVASGENVGEPLSDWINCTGATGLRVGATDTEEIAGCQAGDDNFVSGLDMISGVTYALVVNNFSNTGNGFTVEFDGTGTFLGPEAGFTTTTDSVCYTQTIGFNDASTFAIGSFSSWTWNFGVGATPSTASGPGQHDVQWDTPGTKSIVLTVETDQGCIVTEVRTIEVLPCCADINAMAVSADIEDLICAELPDGAVDLTVNSNAPPHVFEWSTGATTEDIDMLDAGSYTVTITNAATCDTILTYVVDTKSPFTFDTLITMPTCDGGMDGAVTLNTTGGTPPYMFDWGNGFSNVNSINNLPVGDYGVTVQDGNGCADTLLIPVRELELILDPTIQAVTDPSCFGFSDGSIVLNIANGLGPFEFDWNDGLGFVNNNSLNNIPAGTYNIDVRDANRCLGMFMFSVVDPPALDVMIDTIDVSCFGAADGMAIPLVTGGTINSNGYSFNWSDGQQDSVAIGLDVGDYSVNITDANGCMISDGVAIVQPPELFVDLIRTEDVICFGDTTGMISVLGTGGTPPYEYSLEGTVFQIDTLFTGLGAGDYEIQVTDAMGCANTVMATINQPEELLVNAGLDETIDLGFDVQLSATTSVFLGNITYEWTPAEGLICTDCQRPNAIPANTTTYTVVATDEMGCTATDEVTITVLKNRPIYIPNVFSPNGDGANDFFTAFSGPAARQIKILRVFNRWGALVFETTDIDLNDEQLGWNGEFKGQELRPGVFAYFMEIEFIDDEVILYKGDVTILK